MGDGALVKTSGMTTDPALAPELGSRLGWGTDPSMWVKTHATPEPPLTYPQAGVRGIREEREQRSENTKDPATPTHAPEPSLAMGDPGRESRRARGSAESSG